MWVELTEEFATGLATLQAGAVIQVDNTTGKLLIEEKKAKLAPTPPRSEGRGRDEVATAKNKRETAAAKQPGDVTSPE
jgi:hypothetical protein